MRWRDRLLEVLGAVRRVKDSFAFVHRAEVVDREVFGKKEGGREEGEGSQWTHNGLADHHRPGAVQLKVVARMCPYAMCVCVSQACHMCHISVTHCTDLSHA